MDAAPQSYFERIEALIDEARAAHAALLERAPEALRASLPVDATGVTQAIDVLAAAVGIDAEIHAERDRFNRANPAVLHGRVFGRAPLGPDTVIAAFADGARGRRTLIERIAEAVDGAALRDEVAELLAAHPPPEPGAAGGVAALRAAYAAQERAVLLCAGRLDAVGP
jgi:hypothetical protein